MWRTHRRCPNVLLYRVWREEARQLSWLCEYDCECFSLFNLFKSFEEITSIMRINGLKFRSVLNSLSVVSCKLAMKYGHENHLGWLGWPKVRYILGQIGVGGGLERD